MVMLLGIDYGTSSVKTAAIDVDSLQVIVSASEEYRISYPKPGYAEQDPEDWWLATVKTVRQILEVVPSSQIKGIGLSGQMHGVVSLAKDGQWVRPAIIWADTRAIEYVQSLTETIKADPDRFAKISGMPAAGFMAVTLMWLAENEPHALDKIHKVLLPKDAMRYKMTGTIGTDLSDASATWLFDVEAGTWSDDLTDLCHVDSDLLPQLSQSMEVIGELNVTAAEQLGLSKGIPLVAGSADLPAHALGHGLVNAGMGMVTVGTGGQVFMPLSQLRYDPQHRYYTFTHSVKDYWYVQASILSAGSSLRWLRDILGMREIPKAYEQMSAWAETVPAGADGLLFLPYLAGERTPHMDPAASGLFFGLRLHHQREHLVRAVMEGVAFALKSCIELIGVESSHFLLSGGASESTVWRQILADVFDMPLAIAKPDAYGSIGDAIMAGVGTNFYSSTDDAIARIAAPADLIEPIPTNAARYHQFYEQYLALYPLLKDHMPLIARD